FIQQKRLKQALAFYTHAYVKATLQHQQKDSLQWKERMDESKYRLSMINQKLEHRYPALPWSHAFDVKTMMKYLPDTTAVWEYFTGSGKWFAFALNHKGLQGFTLLGKADHLKSDITAFVSHWFDYGPEAMINAPEKFKKQSFEI